MANNKRTAIYVSAIIVVFSSFTPAEDFLKYTPSTSPIVKIATPKPNIYMLLDDSNSMYVTGNDHAYMSVKEHFYGPGDPVCEMPKGDYKKKWDELVKQYENMEGKYYNPLKTGRYKPYLREVIGDAEYEKYDASIPIERCSTKVYRTEAVIQMVSELLEKYSKRAYLGYGGLGKYQLNDFRGATNINIANTTGIWDGVCQSGACTAYYVELFLAKLRKAGESNRSWNLNAAKSIANKTVKGDARYNVFEQPITDMSEYKPNDWARVKSSIAHNIMGEYTNSSNKKNYLLGGTPTFNALYNVSLYFRVILLLKRALKPLRMFLVMGIEHVTT